MNELLFILLGVFIGAIAAAISTYLFLKKQNEQALADQANLYESLKEELTNLKATLESKNTEISELKIDNKGLDTKLQESEKNFDKQISTINDLQNKLKDSFSALAAEALKNNNDNFLNLAAEKFQRLKSDATNTLEAKETKFETLLKPVSEMIATYKSEVEKLQKDNLTRFTKFEEQLGNSNQVNQSLLEETNKLTKLLSSSKQRGQWGEIAIRRILELAGLANHFDFIEQQQDEAGKYPDFVVYLPNSRSIVIDSKFNADSYIKSLETNSDQERQSHLKQHSLNIKATIKALIKKDYPKSNSSAIDFTVMFIPNDSFLIAATEFDPNLIEDALKERIVLATPATLYGLLKAVALGWEEFKLSENAEQIRTIGSELFNRVDKFIEHLSKVGKGLDTAVKGYNEAVGSFKTRLVQQVNRFKELGISTKKELSINQVDNSPRTLLTAVEEDS